MKLYVLLKECVDLIVAYCTEVMLKYSVICLHDKDNSSDNDKIEKCLSVVLIVFFYKKLFIGNTN